MTTQRVATVRYEISIFRRASSHQEKCEIFQKVEFLHDHEELDIGNGTVIFSEQTSFRKANKFFKSDTIKHYRFFGHQLI